MKTRIEMWVCKKFLNDKNGWPFLERNPGVENHIKVTVEYDEAEKKVEVTESEVRAFIATLCEITDTGIYHECLNKWIKDKFGDSNA